LNVLFSFALKIKSALTSSVLDYLCNIE
jgi:hypothetical protein